MNTINQTEFPQFLLDYILNPSWDNRIRLLTLLSISGSPFEDRYRFTLTDKERVILFQKLQMDRRCVCGHLTNREFLWLDSFYPCMQDWERTNYIDDVKKGKQYSIWCWIPLDKWDRMISRIISGASVPKHDSIQELFLKLISEKKYAKS